MKKQGKFLNSKCGRIMMWLCISLIAMFVVVFIAKFIPNRENIIETNDNTSHLIENIKYSGENNENPIIDIDSGETIHSNQAGKKENKSEDEAEFIVLSEDKYKIDKVAKRIIFKDNSDVGIFVLSDNPNGPEKDDVRLFTKGKNEIELDDEAIQKKFVYYLYGNDGSYPAASIADYSSYSSYYNFYIESLSDLQTFRNLVNSGTSFSGKTIYMATSITSNISGWTAIGSSSSYPFSGTFDGNGYYIYSHDCNSGLFGYVSYGTLKNVNIYTLYHSSSSRVSQASGLVGTLSSGTVDNCQVGGGTVYGIDASGGIVGYATGSCTIRNCTNYSYVNITGNSAGGIVGRINSASTIYNCRSLNNAISSDDTAGGIVGRLESGATGTTISYCYNTRFYNCYSTELWRNTRIFLYKCKY